MAAQQGIKRRIRSVSNTRQITKAMQLVAASKLRRAQEASLNARAYAEAAANLLTVLSSAPETGCSPLFEQRPVKNALTVLITSDRGLAGGYNSNVIRAFSTLATSQKATYSVASVGKYAGRYAARVSDIEQIAAYPMDVKDISLELAQPLLTEAIELFLTGKVDVVNVVYTKLISTVRQEVQTVQLLPIAYVPNETGVVRTLEPSPEELLEFAAKRLLEARVSQALLDARASEQASRMLAMKNATDNAGELIDDLTLAFNNARQAAITQELAEISAGAEAITE
jgi:F-type H+-transporting ATPase subunit gamma